ncbi:ABC transporter permease [Pseudoruegeria sp. SK021]|uniref:ABC transporter permease n=1 Tax=Pseudoruegeria sp. SK021 TaxID=1933035 RepID=UPI000A22EAB0|nr:ABC transporter permease [Pseudoruegeria sp. SK021]OSP54892.1 peptide ABC transporter permease [Pseudoruegeria sp. SK021]
MASPSVSADPDALTLGQVLRHPTIFIGVAIMAVMIIGALLAPWLGTVDPQSLSPLRRLKPPSAEAWFGGDMVGRDVFSRTLYGGRVSLMVGLSVATISIFLGLIVGLLAGFVGWVDGIVMRVMDGLMAIPSILLAVALIALTGASVGNVILAITVSEVPRVSRLVRSTVLSLKERPFVEAAIVVGTPFHALLTRHILPNTMGPLLVQGSYIFASAVLTEAALSFIGAGTPPEIPSWGNMISEGRLVFQIAPHMVFFPGVALALTVLAVNMIGDGLRDVLDPNYRAR